MVRSLLAATSFAVLLLAGSVEPVFAQATVPKPITTPDNQPLVRGRKPVEPGPAAVPGARAEPSSAAPAERLPADMPPTEALFDAINRGDTVAAREAIGRGADITGRNVLGLTPLEQSVDLGRNEISFLLLSLRGGAGYSTASGPGRAATGTAGSPAQSRAERRQAAADAARARREQLAQSRTARREAAPAPSHNARLFAGDGGAPVPQAGFLGFDSAR